MGYIAADDILKAREMDLMTYLRNYEPQELVRVSGNTYCTREHESLRISNGKWYWFSHDIGGKSALDYLIKVKDYSFIDAVKTILGNAAVKEPIPYYQKEKVNRNLLMPKLDKDTSQIEKYLYNRGIHPAVTLYCIEKKILYQTAEYHNALFVGYDKEGTPRYGALRATRSPYKGDLTGSNKHFSFSINENPAPEHIHVFESAIDAMSYATMLLLNGRDWKKETFLSLAGVYKEMIDVIFGPFFICDCSGPNYGSLNQEQIDRFMKQFENPERLIRMNGTLMSVPYKPEPDLSR